MTGKYSGIGEARGQGRQARRQFSFETPPEIASGKVPHHPVVVVGGGPIGLATAIVLAQNNIASLVLERHDSVSDGSRAICWSKRTLEILDRIGVADRMVEKGVTWNEGCVYYKDDPDPLYSFDLLPDKQQKYPAFINLQQYFAEEYMVDELSNYEVAELRWQNEVVAVNDNGEVVEAIVDTPAGQYRVTCDYLVAADGHRSPVRQMLGLEFEGRLFEDNFLIADVRTKSDFPAVRRFWFDPPFNPGQTALLHKQADDVLRIDFQMGWDIDCKSVLEEKNVDAKIRAFLGDNVEFDYEWVSLYTFQCRRLERFVHNRIIFVGDSAHVVSPFGARGANGGLQDVDNLVWKLTLILKGKTSPEFLESYNSERVHGADENILNSSRSTDFMTPKTEASKGFRDAVLELARDFKFARAFVNSGRLSVPCFLYDSQLSTPDSDDFSATQRPGSPCLDAPVRVDDDNTWLLNQMKQEFTGLYFSGGQQASVDQVTALSHGEIPIRTLTIGEAATDCAIEDCDGVVARHYDARPGTYYLIRPDLHVAGRWRQFDVDTICAARDRAAGL